MKPRTPEGTPQDDLFRSRLENLISPRHPLVLLAQRIDWEGLNTEFGACYEDAVVGPEDLDFSLRLQELGYKALYIPSAVAHH
jgi:hypothetical protein